MAMFGSIFDRTPGNPISAWLPRQLQRDGRNFSGFQESAPSSGWKLAWGEVAAIAELDQAIWQTSTVALFPVSSQPPSTRVFDEPVAVSPSGRYVMMGDVWLYQRDRLLQPLGLQSQDWRGNDLQLIGQLWERWGESTWSQLIGLFGVAVWDRDRQTLSLGRDRSGAYTLYYTATGPVQWIAPTLRALKLHHTRTVDELALRDYLCCAFVLGDRTLWRDTREVRPGSVVQFPGATVTPYWSLQEQIVEPEQPIQWHSGRLRTRLEQTVKDALPVGEAVGCFLSGGIDSSCVTALACQFNDAPVHTFSLYFGDNYPNELAFSGLVAQHCNTQHHVLEIPLRQLWEALPDAMLALDDPIGDPLTVPNLLLGRMASQYVNVVLNGEGGDPCFGGPKNQPMLIHSLYGGVTQQDAVQAYLASFQRCFSHLPELLKPEIWQAVQSAPYAFEETLHAEMTYLNRLMAINIKFKGADQILTKVNNLTRAAGVQGRSPLFDPRIVDLSMQIPPEYKLSGVQEKAVLKHAVADLLPEAIITRPKSGMMVPVQFGFQKHWRQEARALLLNRKAAIAPYLNQALIANWSNYQGDTWRRYGVKLWLLSSLEMWLQVNGR